MYDESPKRFDRIIAILIQLQSRKIVRAQDMADRFDVSLRTIYRDIRTLEVAGVPIYSEAGIGYSLMDGYRLPPVMFTREEAGSFIAAEKLMAQFTDKELGDHHASAMYKLKAVLRSSEKDLVSNIESKVLVRNSNELFHKNAPNALASIFRSIGEQTQVILMYEAIDAAEPTERVIEPVGVFHEHQSWYVYGYCHLRKDYRQFRTDRIHDIKATAKSFEKSHGALENYLQKGHDTHLDEAIISVPKNIAKYLKYDRHQYGFISERAVGDDIEMTFMTRDLDNGLARWLLMFGDYAVIVAPEKLKLRVTDLLESQIARLKK